MGDEGASKGMLLKRLPMVLLVAALAIGAYFALAASADLASVREAARSIGARTLAIVFLLSIVNYALRYLRWRALLQALDHRIPEGHNVTCYLAGFAFTATPGKVGEAVRSLYLLPYGVPATESIGVLILDRVFDLVAIALVALFLFIPWEFATGLAIVVCLASGFAGFPIVRRHVARAMDWAVALLPTGVRRRADKLGGLRNVASRLVQPRLLIFGMMVGLLAWLAEGYGLYLLVSAMDANFEIGAALGVYALSILIGVASFLPGGVGSTEAAMGLLLARHGLSPQSAIAATILCRVATLWFAVALGVAAAIVLGVRKRSAARASMP